MRSLITKPLSQLNLKKPLLLAISSALLVACGGDDDNDSNNEQAPQAQMQFEISLTNLTANQPQSPAGVIIHRQGYLAFDEGVTASVALEEMAEGGSAAALIAEAEQSDAVLGTYTGPAPVAPGGNRTFTMTVNGDSTEGLYLTGLTMLVNTNDAFTGVNNVSLSGLETGESRSFRGPVWDAGTELNTETLDTIPGPAAAASTQTDEQRGFAGERDDYNNVVVFHSGVLTQAEGLADSVLDQSHRFDQPAVAIRITRVQ